MVDLLVLATTLCEDECGDGGVCGIDNLGNKACHCYDGYEKGDLSLDECRGKLNQTDLVNLSHF